MMLSVPKDLKNGYIRIKSKDRHIGLICFSFDLGMSLHEIVTRDEYSHARFSLFVPEPGLWKNRVSHESNLIERIKYHNFGRINDYAGICPFKQTKFLSLDFTLKRHFLMQ